MRVKLKSAVILTATCEIAPAGETLEVSEETAKDWIARGVAEADAPPVPPPPPPTSQPKGKR